MSGGDIQVMLCQVFVCVVCGKLTVDIERFWLACFCV